MSTICNKCHSELDIENDWLRDCFNTTTCVECIRVEIKQDFTNCLKEISNEEMSAFNTFEKYFMATSTPKYNTKLTGDIGGEHNTLVDMAKGLFLAGMK